MKSPCLWVSTPIYGINRGADQLHSQLLRTVEKVMDGGGEEPVGGGLTVSQSRGQVVALRHQRVRLRHDAALFRQRRNGDFYLLKNFCIDSSLANPTLSMAAEDSRRTALPKYNQVEETKNTDQHADPEEGSL